MSFCGMGGGAAAPAGAAAQTASSLGSAGISPGASALDYLGGIGKGAGTGPGTGGIPAATPPPNGGMSTGPSWADNHPVMNAIGLGPTAGTSQGFVQNLAKLGQGAQNQGNTPSGGGGGAPGALNWTATPANSGKLSF